MNEQKKPMGRPAGSFSHTTMKKKALQFIERAILDESLSNESRLQAALKIMEADHGTK
jgi:hypothetical protein